jgi:hypothetical protein
MRLQASPSYAAKSFLTEPLEEAHHWNLHVP